MPDPNKSLLNRLAHFLTPLPTKPSERRQELIATLREAQAEGLIDADALSRLKVCFKLANFVRETSWCHAPKSIGSISTYLLLS